MSAEKKLYAPIDGKPEERFPLKKTSKGNIRLLADVCSKRIRTEDKDRADWAEQAGHDPINWVTIKVDSKTKKLERFLTADEKKVAVFTTSRKPVYQVDDIFTEYYIHAALAPVLFDGFPPIIEVTGDKVIITNQSAFDNLLEDVVNEAFLEFAGKRNPTTRLLNEFLNHSNGDLSRLIQAAEA